MADQVAAVLIARGLEPGDRVAMLVPPGRSLFAIMFGLFRAGLVPVAVDPAMGVRAVLSALARARPRGLIGVPRAVRVFRLLRRRLPTVEEVFSADGPAAGAHELSWGAAAPVPVESRSGGKETAAILYTSGSTGAAKGVVYSHDIFDAQTDVLAEVFGLGARDVDLSVFPLFSLFSLALGARVVVPDMNFAAPGKVDGAKIVETIDRHKASYAFGSPIFWRRVFDATPDRAPLSTLRAVFMAGAPAPADLLRQMTAHLPDGAEVYTPYGATECLPVTAPSARALLASGAADASEEGRGVCVGAPLSCCELRVVAASDGAMDDSDLTPLAPGAVGEIVVRGPLVTEAYFEMPKATSLAKIPTERGIFHRMGDVGYLDGEGQLWFCGRRAHRVKTDNGWVYPVALEGVMNVHPEVARSAVIGIEADGRTAPIAVLQTARRTWPWRRRKVAAEVLRLLAQHGFSQTVAGVLFVRKLPVDPRHNAKIRRDVLAVELQGMWQRSAWLGGVVRAGSPAQLAGETTA